MRFPITTAVLLVAVSTLPASDDSADAKAYDQQMKPFIARYCLDCHSGDKPKGDFRLDRLMPNFTDEESRKRWQGVLSRVKSGEMPPKTRPRPPEKEAKALVEWIGGRVAQGRTVVRRLNRVEYENTVRDLLGIELDLKDLLPLDASANGFDTSGAALHTSSFLMERYLEAADKALTLAAKRNRLEISPKDPVVDATKVLRNFARRAFRRAVSDGDIEPYLDLVKSKLAEKYSFEAAVRVGLTAVMVSPEFLFLREHFGKLDDFALASRLSYFLWSTMPDDELLALAEKKELSKPDTLRQQVERMLNSPKAKALTENFVGQWLGLGEIDLTAPDPRLYPEFDDLLKESMVKETHLFFDELLKNDLSLMNFVASDFTFLNARLAKHYGIAGVEGTAFRKVNLPPESHRGGVMTMASVLKVTANGTNTSPVVRGAWVLDRILGQTPAPPPTDIPWIEPDVRGAATIREQLAKHRQVASCATCHSKIDPLGFALESFDAIGGWRDNYRSLGRGEAVTIDGRKMPYLKGPKVDPADVLATGEKFANIYELKQLLLKHKDRLARALAEKLLTYGTGARPGEAEREEIEAIVKKVREKNYGFRTLVHEVVQSKVFQTK